VVGHPSLTFFFLFFLVLVLFLFLILLVLVVLVLGLLFGFLVLVPLLFVLHLGVVVFGVGRAVRIGGRVVLGSLPLRLVLIVVTRVGFAGGPRGRHAVAVRVQGSSPPRRLNANSTRQNTLRNLSLHHEFHHQAAATVCRVALRTGRGHRTLDTMLAPHCLPDALPELAHAG